MKRFAVLSLALAMSAASLGLVACGDGEAAQRAAGGGIVNEPATPDQVTVKHTWLALSDGSELLPSDSVDDISTRFLTGHLGNPTYDRVFRVTTMADQEFALNLLASRQYNAGRVSIRIGHVADNHAQPNGGFETAIAAGMRIDNSEMVRDGNWVNLTGDGLVQSTLRGNISTPQILAMELYYDGMLAERSAVEISISGSNGDVNLDASVSQVPLVQPLGDEIVLTTESDVVETPVVAATEDRVNLSFFEKVAKASVAEGFEIRRSLAMFNRNTGGTLSAFAVNPRPGIGDWYDQDASSRGQVVVNANVGSAGVRIDISVDGGVTYPITRLLDVGTSTPFGQRQVSTTISEEYRIAVSYWDSTVDAQSNDARSNMRAVMCNPTINGTTGEVTGYTILDSELVRSVSDRITNPVNPINNQPLPTASTTNIKPGSTGVVINDVTGQITFVGLNSWGFPGQASIGNVNNLSGTLSIYESDQLAILQNGGIDIGNINCMTIGQFLDIAPRDPQVAVMGDTHLVAFDGDNGIRLVGLERVNQSTITQFGSYGSKHAYMPRVIAREVAGDMRVDLFYLDQGTHGLELFNVHWDTFTDGSGGTLRRVTTATRQVSELEVGSPARQFTGKTESDFITEISSNGYDATFDGTNVVVLVHEEIKSVYDYLNRAEWASKVDFRRNAYDYSGTGDTTPIPTAGIAPAPVAGARNTLRVITME